MSKKVTQALIFKGFENLELRIWDQVWTVDLLLSGTDV